jgi:hypothetical protein
MSQVGNVGSLCKYKETQYGYNKRNAFRIRALDINKNYLFYYLKSNEFKNKILSNGSIVKFISIPNLKLIKLKIPKNKQLIKDFEPLFQQIETLQTELKEAEELYKKLIKELSEEAMPSNKQELTKTNLLINEEKEDENEEEKTPSETSSTSSTTSIKSLHAQCKVLKIKGYTKYKKKEDKEKLLELIQQHSKE